MDDKTFLEIFQTNPFKRKDDWDEVDMRDIPDYASNFTLPFFVT